MFQIAKNSSRKKCYLRNVKGHRQNQLPKSPLKSTCRNPSSQKKKHLWKNTWNEKYFPSNCPQLLFLWYFFCLCHTGTHCKSAVMVKQIITLEDDNKVADELRTQILNAAEEAISSRNVFKIGLSGSAFFTQFHLIIRFSTCCTLYIDFNIYYHPLYREQVGLWSGNWLKYSRRCPQTGRIGNSFSATNESSHSIIRTRLLERIKKHSQVYPRLRTSNSSP